MVFCQEIGSSFLKSSDAADVFFSPTLTCEACGTDIKRYRCERTGEVHTVPEDQPMSRWTTIEIEYRCPECGDSIWYVDTSSQYPYPMF